MDQLLYKGFVVLDDIKNRDVKNQKPKDDYLMRKIKEGDEIEKDRDEDRKKLKKPQNYSVFLPKLPELNATKILNDHKYMVEYLSCNDKQCYQTENFQRRYMQELPKLLWQTEKLEDMGDYVLLFPNPDKAATKTLDKFSANRATLKEIMSYFDEIFLKNYNYPFKRKFMDNLRKSFEDTFVTLEENRPLTTKEKDSNKENVGGIFSTIFPFFRNSTNTDADKDISENDKKYKDEVELKNTNTVQQKEGQFRDNKQTLKDDINKPTFNNQEVDKNGPNSVLDQDFEKGEVDGDSKGGSKSLVPDLDNDDNLKTPDPLLSSFKTPEINRLTPKKRVPQKEIEIPKTGKALEEEEKRLRALEKAKHRKIWAGGLYKPQTKENCHKTPSAHYWMQSPQHGTRDIMTLIRKTVCAALANQGFLIREIFVNGGDNIAVILTLAEPNLRKVAAELRITKTVEFGVADLLSLEPVDNKNRPLRLNSILKDEHLWELTYVQGEDDPERPSIMAIRKEICELLERDCNMNKIVRICKGIWPELDSNTHVFEQEKPELEIWIQYLSYLQLLAMHMREIRLLKDKINYIEASFYGDRRMSVQGNLNTRAIYRTEITRLLNRLVVRAFKECNEGFEKLVTLWDEMGIEPGDYAYEYENATNHMRPGNRRFYDLVWMDFSFQYPYHKDENQHLAKTDTTEKLLSLNNEEKEKLLTQHHEDSKNVDSENFVYNYAFNKVERLKIVYYMVHQVINIEALQNFNRQMEKVLAFRFSLLVNLDFLKKDETIFFPLHDRRLISDHDYHTMFAPLRKVKEIYDSLPSEKIQIQYQMDEKLQDPFHDPKYKASKDNNVDREAVASSHYNQSKSSLGKERFHHNVKSKRHIQNKSESFNRNSVLPNTSNQEGKSIHSDGDGVFADGSKSNEHLFALHMMDRAVKFGSPYLNSILDKYYGKEPKADSPIRKIFAQKGMVVVENDTVNYATVANFYSINSEKLVAGMLEALTTQKDIRSALLTKFNALDCFDVQSPVEMKNSYPLNESFANHYFMNQEKYPESTMRNYFGEKIALYFAFVNFYKDRMSVIMIWGLIIMGLQLLFYFNVAGFAAGEITKTVFEVITALFCCYVMIWSLNFFLKWQAYEQEFSIRYGLENTQETRQIRQGFVGTYQRSLTEDKVNSVGIDRKTYFRRVIISGLVLLVMLLGTGLSSYYLLIAKRKCDSSSKCIFGTALRSKRLLQQETKNDGYAFGNTSKITPAKHLIFVHKIRRELQFPLDPPVDALPPELSNPILDSNITDGYDPYSGDNYDDANSNSDTNPDDFSLKSPYIPDTLDSEGGDVFQRIKNFFEPNQLFFNMFEFFRIMIFQSIACRVIKAYIKWLNLKYEDDHEKLLILNLSVYQIVNNSIMIIIVAIQALTASEVPALINGEHTTTLLTGCIDNRCTQELSNFFMVYCILHVVWQILKRVIIDSILIKTVIFARNSVKIRFKNLLKSRLSKRKNELRSQSIFEGNAEGVQGQVGMTWIEEDEVEYNYALDKLPHASTSPTNVTLHVDNQKIQHPVGFSEKLHEFVTQQRDLAFKEKQIKLNDRIITKFYSDPASMYKKINEEIDYQVSNLEDTDTQGDGDTVEEYLPFFNSLSYSSLFGVVFPLCFFTCWCIAFIESALDRRSYLFQYKRQRPVSAKGLGLWLLMIRMLALFSVWTNSFYVCFILLDTRTVMVKFSVFLLMCIVMSGITFVYHELGGGISSSVEIFINRTKFLKKYIFTKAQKGEDAAKSLSVDWSNKVFGEVVRKKGTNLVDIGEEAKQENEAAEFEILETLNAANIAKERLEQPMLHGNSQDLLLLPTGKNKIRRNTYFEREWNNMSRNDLSGMEAPGLSPSTPN